MEAVKRNRVPEVEAEEAQEDPFLLCQTRQRAGHISLTRERLGTERSLENARAARKFIILI